MSHMYEYCCPTPSQSMDENVLLDTPCTKNDNISRHRHLRCRRVPDERFYQEGKQRRKRSHSCSDPIDIAKQSQRRRRRQRHVLRLSIGETHPSYQRIRRKSDSVTFSSCHHLLSGYLQQKVNNFPTQQNRSTPELRGELRNFLGSGQRYHLKRFIGKGVFAYVFSAWDTFENREVALKIFRRHPVYQDTGFEERKILEHISQQQRKLGENKGDTCDGVKKNDYDNDDDNDDEDGNEVYHTSGRHNQNHYFHIVPCLDAFYTPDRLCLVFPCHSHNLRQLCRYTNGRGIQLHQVQRIAKQLLVALDFLSKPSVDIIHADLKPENIVLEKQRNVVNVQLLDFGNSRRRHEATERGYIQTLWYRSPECLLSLPWDQSIDVWSLGCVLFELHKGRPLFYAENEQELALSIEKLMGRFPPSMVEASPERFSLFKQYNDRVKKDDGTTARGRPLYLVNHPRKHQGERPKLSYVKDLRTNLCAHRGGLDKKNADKNIDKMMTAYELFIDFLHHMLEYHPTDRSTPKELLRHPFLSFEM